MGGNSPARKPIVGGARANEAVHGEAACTLDHGVEDDPHEEPPAVAVGNSRGAPNTTLGRRICSARGPARAVRAGQRPPPQTPGGRCSEAIPAVGPP